MPRRDLDRGASVSPRINVAVPAVPTVPRTRERRGPPSAHHRDPHASAPKAANVAVPAVPAVPSKGEGRQRAVPAQELASSGPFSACNVTVPADSTVAPSGGRWSGAMSACADVLDRRACRAGLDSPSPRSGRSQPCTCRPRMIWTRQCHDRRSAARCPRSNVTVPAVPSDPQTAVPASFHHVAPIKVQPG